MTIFTSILLLTLNITTLTFSLHVIILLDYGGSLINFFPLFNLLSFYKCLVITGACSLYRTSMVLSFHNITFTKKLIILDFYHTISVYVLNPTC